MEIHSRFQDETKIKDIQGLQCTRSKDGEEGRKH